MLAYAILLPWFAWSFSGRGVVAADASQADVTAAMLVYLITCPIAATFLGTYLVTRDYYYKSIARAVLTNRKQHVFVGKLAAGAAGGLVVGVVGASGWTAISVTVLNGRGQSVLFDATTIQAIVGCAVASALAGVLGVAILCDGVPRVELPAQLRNP